MIKITVVVQPLSRRENRRKESPITKKRPTKMEVSTTTIDDENGVTICENAMRVNIPSLDKTLVVTLIQSEWEMEVLNFIF
jgi:hypothetical protein